ncbi:hypothetical protein BJ878DRAFT_553570 [Calycina marina]|uniref:Uncharacterized protein n=1 Tax=Calycina marina TaxID=1763456 RepID=A0A9P7Z907_9HELO|nr:hypothetical protein BJ878DRAFT_553570 [Calycina marina]
MITSIMVALGMEHNLGGNDFSSYGVYSFSTPLVLILPYFISLGLTLPFILIGCIALFKKRKSAMDGSFEQITATTGSSALDQATAGGCLGGDSSLPRELLDMKI